MRAPKQLAEWDLPYIQRLISEDISENDQFDFKGALDELPANKLRATVCSFANSGGGFLVFGVAEQGSGTERLIGIPRSREHLKQLQDKLKAIEPSVDVIPCDPPIAIAADRIVLVVEVPRSLRAPHWSPDERKFWKRGKGTKVEMSHDEVRIAFTNHAERVGRLRLVYLSLVDNWIRLEDIVAPEGGEGPVPLTVPDWNPIRSHLGDVQSLRPDLVPDLFSILKEGDAISVRCNHMFMAASQQFLEDQRRTVKYHKGEINFAMQRLQTRFQSLLNRFQSEFAFEAIAPRGPQGPSIPPIPAHWRH